jgi:hypothetical protein
MEPLDEEEAMLVQLDYAGNERTNRGYRQLMLPNGETLSALPTGQYL